MVGLRTLWAATVVLACALCACGEPDVSDLFSDASVPADTCAEDADCCDRDAGVCGLVCRMKAVEGFYVMRCVPRADAGPPP